MIFLMFAEWALIGGIILLLVTQIVLPLFLGMPLFPMFRSRWRGVQDDLKDVQHTNEYIKWRQEVERQMKQQSGGDSK